MLGIQALGIQAGNRGTLGLLSKNGNLLNFHKDLSLSLLSMLSRL